MVKMKNYIISLVAIALFIALLITKVCFSNEQNKFLISFNHSDDYQWINTWSTDLILLNELYIRRNKLKNVTDDLKSENF